MSTKEYPFVKYKQFNFSEEEVDKRAKDFYEFMNHRRVGRSNYFLGKPFQESLLVHVTNEEKCSDLLTSTVCGVCAAVVVAGA